MKVRKGKMRVSSSGEKNRKEKGENRSGKKGRRGNEREIKRRENEREKRKMSVNSAGEEMKRKEKGE